jgi:hypothetical protein
MVHRLVPKNPAEPETKSWSRLVAWLDGPPRRNQALLAKACGVSQQLISDYKRRGSRPRPASESAVLLEIATQGFVPADGWLTDEEANLRAAQRERVATFARTLSTSGPEAKPIACNSSWHAGARSQACSELPTEPVGLQLSAYGVPPMRTKDRATLLRLRQELDALLEETPAGTAPAAADEVRWMRIKQFAQEHSYSSRTISQWLKLGMPHIGRGHHRRIDVKAAEKWIAEGGPPSRQ